MRRAAHGPAERRFPLGTMRALIEPLLGVEAARDPFAPAPRWARRRCSSTTPSGSTARRSTRSPTWRGAPATCRCSSWWRRGPSDALAELAGIPGVGAARARPAQRRRRGRARAPRRARRPGSCAPAATRRRVATSGCSASWPAERPTAHSAGADRGAPPPRSAAAPERRVAHALAILGDGADPHRTAEVAQVAVGDIGGIRERLAWNGLDVGVAHGVYDELPLAERERLHRAAAPRCDAPASRPRRSPAISCAAAPRPIPRPPPRCARPPPAPRRARRSAYLERALLDGATTARRCSPSSPPPPSTPGGRTRAAAAAGARRAAGCAHARGDPHAAGRAGGRRPARPGAARRRGRPGPAPSPASTRC